MNSFFVSPDGCDDHPGTESQPFKTLERAHRDAQTAPEDAVVFLRTGTYQLASPWRITCGGEKHITYQAFGWGGPDEEKPVISGGRCITNWVVGADCWQAYLGDVDFHQLYVNEDKVDIAKVDTLPGNWERTETGYKIDTVLDLHAPSSIQFVYHGIYPWTEARLNVASIEHDDDGTTITMAAPGWERADLLYNYSWDTTVQHGPQNPTRLENDLSFLRDPGTFVVDRSRDGQHTLYYKPRPGETPDNTHVEAPTLQQLITLQGARDLTFRGVTFTKATWLQPEEGFLHYYGHFYYAGEGSIDKVVLGGDGDYWVMVPSEMDGIGACLELSETANVRFESCNFNRLGGAAIGSKGCRDVHIANCILEDLPSLGISLSDTRNARVHDTLITRNGLDFPGSPAISIQRTKDCVFSHNEINDTSHSGIILATNHGLRITNNLISKTMGKLADGGGVHIANSQGDSFETGLLFRENVVVDVRTEYNTAIYTDDASKWVTIEDNVVKRADSVLTFEATPPIDHIIYRGNFWDKGPEMPVEMPSGILYENNRVIEDEEELGEAAKAIYGNAGIRARRPFEV